MYPFSDIAVQYIINQLFVIAGFIKTKDFEIIFNREASSISVPILGDKQLVFKVMRQIEIEQFLKGQLSLKKILSFDTQVEIPVFFINNEDNFASISGEKMIVNVDMVTVSFIVLSNYEELLTTERDQHDRFQFKNSLSYKYDFIDIPIVDEYAMLLRMWLVKFIPTLKIEKRKCRVIPTHDIDGIRRFSNLTRDFQTIFGGDLITRQSFQLAYKSFKQCLATLRNTKNDPFILAIKLLISYSRRADLCSEFYFMGLRNGQNDARYDIFLPEVKYCMDIIKEAGMIVGIHGGYDSYDNEDIFKHEKENIESVCGKVVHSGRQHYLRFGINKSLHVWEKCGISNDSTLGYPEREGFRCGTCHEYLLYDLKNDRISTVREHPLIVMDKTLFEFSTLNKETALAKIRKLYTRCQAVEGDFVILWHNAMVFRDYELRFREVYCTFIESIYR